ncbi:HNH endonuclease family protein [Arthrobacter sp. SDTb3-6]|uniref:HNH endonuclease family protein n=1 Tax=Arthrobacter sp. SDTb3-6 TaxID=2713571 RepID=UPI00159E9BD8|nr:HNH endonuclease family protein [Arthrobacter sp. SDTb3-6]NVN00104.1 HNH endonuclease [Arthrobacter sp. SDTb3-6]
MARHELVVAARRRARTGPPARPARPVRHAGRGPGDGPGRTTEGGLLRAAALLLVLLTVAVGGWLHAAGRWPFEPDAGPPPTVSTPPPGLGRPVLRLGPATALAVLDTLPVKGRAAKTTYKRSEFGEAWLDADANGCDTRNDILRRDLHKAAFESGSQCVVASGTLAEPYTGRTVDFRRGAATSAAVQIDHVVALGNAWETGAQQLTPVQRQSLANDPLNLLAADGEANQEKSDGDAATWLPPDKSFRCRYVARLVSVKAAYRLWVTPAEKAAMVRVLGACPGLPSLPSGYAAHP